MRKRVRYDHSYFRGIIHREARRSQRNYQRLEKLLRLKRGGRLLEIGFGQGGFLEMAARHFEVYGIDISPWAIANAPRRLRHRVQVQDISESSLGHQEYAAIAAFNVLEHLDDPPTALGRIAHALTPGGVLIGSVLNNGGIVGHVVTAIANAYDRTHVCTPRPEQWRQWFQQAGLEEIDLFGEITIGRNRCYYVKRPVWRQVAFNLMFTCRAPMAQKATTP
ncbi:MAG: class I SAM-dependent methyltransferase [Anaerolineae bacterium]